MIYLNLILLSVIVYGVFYLSRIKKESVVESLKKDHHILKKKKGYPNWSDADPNFQILKDIVKSVELERWSVTVEKRSAAEFYEVVFTNPSSNLSLRATLRFICDEPRISYTRVRVYSDSVNYKTLMVDDSDYSANLVFDLVWNAIILHHDNLWNENLKNMSSSIETIKKRLKTLNRDRELDKLI